jgi:hypothetical protein
MGDRGGECTTCMERVSARLGGQAREVHLLVRDGGIILQGTLRTYHAKQLVLQAVLEATDLPILANQIEVRGAGRRPCEGFEGRGGLPAPSVDQGE